MKRRKFKPSIGDVFAIPIGNELFSFGQIVAKNCYVIYNVTGAKNEYSIDQICGSEIIFFAHTVDNNIEDGKWPLLGKADIPSINFPLYKVMTLKGEMVTNHEGTIIRPITEDEKKYLKNLKSYSPVVLEQAVRANFGDGEWYPYLDNLLYSNIIK